MKEFEKYMSLALCLAEKGRGTVSPNPLVGAVIVKDGNIVGRGWHSFAGGPHAEIVALSDAAKRARGAILYVSLEPCSTEGRTPPCTEAIIKAGIKTVVYGISDPNPKHSGRAEVILREAGLDVIHPVLEDRCRIKNEVFFKWIRTGIPFITLKLGLSLDAKIADFNGSSRWITSERSRKRVQYLRLSSDAILIGAETLRKDHPSLTVRDFKKNKQPLRLVVSSTLTVEDARNLFSSPDGGGEVRVLNLKTKGEWLCALRDLGRENISSILVEGGAKIASVMLDFDLVDKIEFHYAPIILGSGAVDAMPICGRKLSDAFSLSFAKIAKCGSDFTLTAYRR